ncbi:MAG: hypothetical protein PWQ57_1475 [Desulfovibrionales bacterium]|nr:hypothetical protein [Desulfovibrionales bacterium]
MLYTRIKRGDSKPLCTPKSIMYYSKKNKK